MNCKVLLCFFFKGIVIFFRVKHYSNIFRFFKINSQITKCLKKWINTFKNPVFWGMKSRRPLHESLCGVHSCLIPYMDCAAAAAAGMQAAAFKSIQMSQVTGTWQRRVADKWELQADQWWKAFTNPSGAQHDKTPSLICVTQMRQMCSRGRKQ